MDPQTNMSSGQVNHHILKKFIKRLDSLSLADYNGLSSPGLTCYLNSVLQVLFMTEDFRKAVIRSSKNSSSSVIDSHLAELFCKLQHGTASTETLIKKLGITELWEQRDAAEYLERVLSLTSEDASKIFKGKINHVSFCKHCQHENKSSNNFWVLPLTIEVSSKQPFDTRDGIKAFFEAHEVYGENRIYCNNCRSKQDADIIWKMEQHPDVLTLLLKRFTFNRKHQCYEKLRCNVSIPQRLQGWAYELYAIIHHFGSLTGGHYSAVIKSFETSIWYDFNDGVIKNVDNELFWSEDKSLRSFTAYLLLYRKGNENPNVREQQGRARTPVPLRHKKENGSLSEDVKARAEKASPDVREGRAPMSAAQRRRRASSLPPRDDNRQPKRGEEQPTMWTIINGDTPQTEIHRGRTRTPRRAENIPPWK